MRVMGCDRAGGRGAGAEAQDESSAAGDDEEVTPAQIVVCGNTTAPEALCICEVLREIVQRKTEVVTEVARSSEASELHLQSAEHPSTKVFYVQNLNTSCLLLWAQDSSTTF